MLVISRFRVPEMETVTFRAGLEAASEILAGCSGIQDIQLGRNVDEPDLWSMVTRWVDVGSYRRALSSYDVKVGVIPLLNRVIDEPSAYETVIGDLNTNEPRQLDHD